MDSFETKRLLEENLKKSGELKNEAQIKEKEIKELRDLIQGYKKQIREYENQIQEYEEQVYNDEYKQSKSEIEDKIGDCLNSIAKAFEERENVYESAVNEGPNQSNTDRDHRIIEFYETVAVSDQSLKNKIEEDYQKAKERAGLRDKKVTAGIVISKGEQDQVLLYPTVMYISYKLGYSLTDNLMAHTANALFVAGAAEFTDKELDDGRIEIVTQCNDVNRLVEILRDTKPDEFDKANIEFFVLPDFEYKQQEVELEKEEKVQYAKEDAEEEKIYLPEDVAKIRKVHPTTIRTDIRKGILKAENISTSKRPRYRITEKNLDEYLTGLGIEAKTSKEEKLEKEEKVQYAKEDAEEEKIYLPEDVAKIRKVHPTTIRTDIRKGILKAENTGTSEWPRYRITWKNLDEYLTVLGIEAKAGKEGIARQEVGREYRTSQSSLDESLESRKTKQRKFPLPEKIPEQFVKPAQDLEKLSYEEVREKYGFSAPQIGYLKRLINAGVKTEPQYMSFKEAAEYVDTSQDLIYRLHHQGRFEGDTLINGKLHIPRATLEPLKQEIDYAKSCAQAVACELINGLSNSEIREERGLNRLQLRIIKSWIKTGRITDV